MNRGKGYTLYRVPDYLKLYAHLHVGLVTDFPTTPLPLSHRAR